MATPSDNDVDRSAAAAVTNSRTQNGSQAKIQKPRSRAQVLMGILQDIFVKSGALRSSIVNFLLCYNIRAGISMLLRFLTVIRSKPKKIFDIGYLVSESNISFREEAVRTGLFVGGFTGLYKSCRALLSKLSSDDDGKPLWWHSAASGYVAGTSLLFMAASWHRTLALYIATRAAQCFYNFAKANGYWHFWGSDWAHGDSLLFILSSAQVMYAYVMRPETLPPSYYRFIVKQGPIDGTILQAVRDNNRGNPVDVDAVKEYISRTGGQSALDAVQEYLANPSKVMTPSRVLHPDHSTLVGAAWKAFSGVSKQIFPVYLALAYVPAVVLRFNSFVKHPAPIAIRSLTSAIRSTVFLSTFCGGYMAFVDLYRILANSRGWGDHKLIYYVAGIFSSMSILIERKSRRSELALYAFPRGADSLYMILNDHKLMFSIPQGELVLFSTAMAVIMYFYENDRDSMNPFLVKVMNRFFPSSYKSLMVEDSPQSSPKSRASDTKRLEDFVDVEEEVDNNSSPKKLTKEQRRTMHGNPSVLSLSGSSIIP